MTKNPDKLDNLQPNKNILKSVAPSFAFTAGANPNLILEPITGESLLMRAIMRGSAEQVERLLRLGGDPNLADNKGQTALFYAMRRGDVKILTAVLNKGVLLTHQDRTGNNALMVALRDHCPKATILHLLAEQKFNFGQQNKKGESACHLAVGYNDLALFEVLLQKTPELYDKQNYHPLHTAICEGEPAFVRGLKHLWDGLPLRTQKTGETILHLFLKRKDDDLLSFALAGKTARFINTGDEAGRTPLHLASEMMLDMPVVRKMVDLGGDLNAVDSNGQSAFTIAMSQRNLVRIREYMRLGASPKQKSFNLVGAYSPLIMALQAQDLKLFEFLLERGADVNQKDKIGNTPLLEAMSGGHEKLVLRLLELGADVHAKTQFGYNVFSFIRHNTSLELVKRFLDLKVDTDSKSYQGNVLNMVLQFRRHDLSTLLIDHGAPFNTADMQGNLPQHLAYQCGYFDLVKKLLDKGADVNAGRIYDGQTLLFQAVYMNKIEDVKYLLGRGANLQQLGANNVNLLHVAAVRGSVPMIEYLLSLGFDPRIENGAQQSPALLARVNNHYRAAIILQEKADELNVKEGKPKTKPPVPPLSPPSHPFFMIP
jgi:hypothetical protein